MVIYQDLLEIPRENESERLAFIQSAINKHKASGEYQMAVTADLYDHKQNETIDLYEKTITTMTGQVVADVWSPNHKTKKNFFNYFVTQQNQYLLGNGVMWKDDATKEKLGDDFDNKLQDAGRYALVQGEAFGFWNLDHLDVFKLTEFVPIIDEENGALMAGIRFWCVEEGRPMRAVLYEVDGYTSYIWNERASDGKVDEHGRVYKEKQPYKITVKYTGVDGVEIMEGENYPTFPIVPLWGNKHHQSELVGIQEGIDAYDLIKNGYLNDLDTAQILWILRGTGGMDDIDMVKFLERIHMMKMANLDADQDAQPVAVQIPYEAREQLLDRIKRDLYEDYMALDVNTIRSGAATATEILAAYEPMNNKADGYEYCIRDFIKGILSLAGIDDQPSFTRSKLVNVTEEIQTVLQAATTLDDEYVTQKVLTLLGDIDQLDDVMKRKEADELQKMQMAAEMVAIQNGGGVPAAEEEGEEEE